MGSQLSTRSLDEACQFDEMKPTSFLKRNQSPPSSLRKCNSSPRSPYAVSASSPASLRDRRVDRLARRVDAVLAAQIARLETRLREAFADEIAHLRSELREARGISSTSPKATQGESSQYVEGLAKVFSKQMNDAAGIDSGENEKTMELKTELRAGDEAALPEQLQLRSEPVNDILLRHTEDIVNKTIKRDKTWSVRSSAVLPVPPKLKQRCSSKCSNASAADSADSISRKRRSESSEIRLQVLSRSLSQAASRGMEEGASTLPRICCTTGKCVGSAAALYFLGLCAR